MLNIVSTFVKQYFSHNRLVYFQIKKITGYAPGNFSFYKTALTHKSASTTDKRGNNVNNERLEYLGDAVLGAVIADYFFRKFPGADEGFLTQMRSKIVSREKLNELSKLVGISDLIISNTGRYNMQRNIHGDTMEAFIGAVYLDKGFSKTARFIRKQVIREYINIPELLSVDHNHKSRLIEWGQKNKQEVQFYTDQDAPDSKHFISFVKINNKIYGSGLGTSKKVAEQKAAKETLEKIEKNEDN